MKKIVVLIFLFTISLMAYSLEEIKKVNLNDAINIALDNNVNLKAKSLDINIASNDIKIADRLQNPTIMGGYLFGAAGNNEPKQIGITQSIEINKRYSRKQLEQAKHKLVEKNVGYTKFDLIMDVREAYIQLVTTKSVLDTLIQQKNFQEQLLMATKEKSNANSAFLDAIQVEIGLNQLVAQVNSAKSDVNFAKNRLNKVINASNSIIYDSVDDILSENNNFNEMNTPAPTLKFPDISEIMEIALKKRKDLEIALQEIEVAKADLVVSQKARIPDLTVGAGYAYQTKNYSDTGATLGGGFVGVGLENIPIFYSHAPEIQNKAYKLNQAELNYYSLKDKAKKDVASAYDRFLTCAENLNHYEKNILPNSEKLMQTSVSLYQKGKIDFSDLIISKQTYKTTIIGYTYALADYYNAWTNFLREINDEQFEFKMVNL